MEIELVIFDCDGVLVDSELISSRIMAEIFTEMGLPMTMEEVFNTLRGGSMKNTLNFVKTKLGREIDFDLESEYRRRSFDAYQKEMKAIEGIEDILNGLQVPFCVGSNGPQHKIKLNLDITGLRQYFKDEHIFSAYDIQTWKPLPDLYQHAAAHFNISPRKCLVIEDSIGGATAAREAGMTCFGYCRDTDKNDLKSVGARPIESMSEIRTLLADIF